MDGVSQSPVQARLDALDWERAGVDLDAQGFATLGPLLTAAECAALAGLYDDDTLFRSRVVMARHGFGRGEYRYFGYPLPPFVQALREAAYGRLAPVANRWAERLDAAAGYPARLADYTAQCHEAGQARPTPLLLRYGPGDYNCLHQDLYGALAFPLQLAVLLDEPGADFTGGEFVLVEQRPRVQSRAEVVPLGRGEAVVFAVNEFPRAGKRGFYRVKLRHGVSRLHSGERRTLGVIFHDAA